MPFNEQTLIQAWAQCRPPPSWPKPQWQVLEECTSSNSLLLNAPLWPADVVPVLIPLHQTAGRGQRGQVWVDKQGQSLMLSCGFARSSPFLNTAPSPMPAWLTLAVGLALLEGLMASGFSELKIKWPNDIFWRGRKLAGVLVEQTPERLIIGVGINRTPLPEGQFSLAWRGVTSLSEMVGETHLPNSSLILSRLMASLFSCMEALGAQQSWRITTIRQRWSTYCALAGQSINFRLPNGEIWHDARYQGLDEQGGLMLLYQGREHTLYSGQIVGLAPI